MREGLYRKLSVSIGVNLILASVVLHQSAIAAPEIKFTGEFPQDKVYASKDYIQLDLAQYVKGTFDVTLKTTPPGWEENLRLTKPLTDLFVDPPARLVDRDCRNVIHINQKRDFLMMCGNNGFNIIYINVNNVNLAIESTSRLSIKADPMTQELSINKCHGMAFSQLSQNGYVVCESSVPKGKETSVSPSLYFISFLLTQNGIEVQSVFTRQQDFSTKLNGELVVIVHSEKKQNADEFTDSLQLFERVDFGRKKDYKAEAVQYAGGAFTNPIKIDKSKIQGYPSNELNLYEVVSVASEVWLVFKKIVSQGSGEEEQTQVTFFLFSCGFASEQGLKCSSPVETITLPGQEATGIKFLFSIIPGNRLNPHSSSKFEVVITSKIGLWAGELISDSVTQKLVYSSVVEYTKDEKLSVINEPQDAYVIDDKIYFSAYASDEKDKDITVTKVFVYYNSNQALTKGYTPFDGDGRIFVRDSVFAGDYHELFFIGSKLSSFAGIKTHQFNLVINPFKGGGITKDDNVSLVFTLPISGDDKNTRIFDFSMKLDPVGILKASVEDKVAEVYTLSKFRLPTYADDFDGNLINFSISSNNRDFMKDGKCKMSVSYAGKRKVKDLASSEELKLEFSNIKESAYLNNDNYLFLEGTKGLMLVECSDSQNDEPTDDIGCDLRALVPYQPEESPNKTDIPGDDLVDSHADQKGFFAVFFNTSNKKSYLYYRDFDAIIPDTIQAEIDFPVASAAIFKHSDIWYVYLISSTNKADLRVISFKDADKLKIPQIFDESKIQKVQGLPRGQICPFALKFFPHKKPEFAVGSECSFNGTPVNRVFKFRMEVDKKTNLYDPTRVTLISTHNSNTFSKPDFCVTDGYIHVFETDKDASEVGSVMTSYSANESDGSSYHIPIRETNDPKTKVNSVRSFFCDKTKNAVILTADIEAKLTAVFTINVDQIQNPNKRIHSGNVFAKTDLPMRIVAGSRPNHDQLIILGTTEQSKEFYAMYASLNGPHFKYPFADQDTPSTTSIDFTITMTNSLEKSTTAVSRIKLQPFVTQGKVYSKSVDKVEISKYKEDQVVDLAEIFRFEGPVVSLEFESNLDVEANREQSNNQNSIEPILVQNQALWPDFSEDIQRLDVEKQFMIYTTKSQDYKKTIAKILKNGEKTPLESVEMEHIDTVKMVKSEGDYCAVVIGRDGGKLTIYVAAPNSSGKWILSKPDLEKASAPEELSEAIVNFTPAELATDQIILNILAKDNDDTPSLVAFTIGFNPNDESATKSELLGHSYAEFDEPIVSFSAAFTSSFDRLNKENQVGQDKKGGAIAIVSLESKKALGVVGYVFKSIGSLDLTLIEYKNFPTETRLLNHQDSKVDCQPILKMMNDQTLHTIECALATSDTRTMLFRADIAEFAMQKAESRVVIGEIQEDDSIFNLRSFKPDQIIRDEDYVIVKAARRIGAPTTEASNFIDEDWLILFYYSNLSKYPTQILTKTDLGFEKESKVSSDLVTICHLNNGSKRSDHLFIGVFNRSSSLQGKSLDKKSMLRSKTSNAVKKLYSYDVHPFYKWNIRKHDLLSPNSKDFFKFHNFKSVAQQFQLLSDVTVNKDDPKKPGPSPGPNPPGPQPKPKTWLYVLISILVASLVAGAVVYFIMKKNQEDDYDNLVVDEEKDDSKPDYNQVQDDKTLTESEYSRLQTFTV